MKLVLASAVALLFTGAAEWTSKAPLPESRTEVSAATDGHRIYLAGGFGPPEGAERATAPRRLWVWDSGTDRWTSPTELPEGVHHAGMTYLNGRVYVVGGFRETSFVPVGNVRIYDVAASTWSEGRPMPTPRGAGALAVLNGRIHWTGGNAAAGDHLHDPPHGQVAGDRSVGTHEVYDPATDTWERLAPMPTPRNHHGATVVDGRMHVVAGRAERNFEMTVHEVYDPARNTWEAAPPIPTGRSGIATVELDGKIYVFGGETFTQPARTFYEAERYDPRTRTWESLPRMPTARHGLAAAVLDGRIHVLSGGPSPGFAFSGAHEVLTPPRQP